MNKNLLKELTGRIKETKKEQSETIEEITKNVNLLIDQKMCCKKSKIYHITSRDVADMVALYELVKHNKSLNNSDLKIILKRKYKLGLIVSKIQMVTPDIITELDYLGPYRMLCKYARIIIWQEELKEEKTILSKTKFFCI